MDTEIRLLEDRVRRAVERIRELSTERARLTDEVKSLRADLERMTRESKRQRQAERRDPELAAWSESIRSAIRELRGA